MINSSVLRHSSQPYGAYKMTKASLLALAQCLASELGPSGVRVNSVAPGWIWADVLQAYFGYLAKKREVDPQVVYDEIAPPSTCAGCPSRTRSPTRSCSWLRPVPRDHRPLPRRELRGVPPLASASRSARSRICTRRPRSSSGSTDFGSDEYLEPLQVLLDSYATEERLTPLGSKVKRAELRGALVARALSEASFAQHADTAPVDPSDLRDRAAAHRHHGAAPVALRRPGAPGSRTVAGRVPAAAPAARARGPTTRSTSTSRRTSRSSTPQNPDFAGVHYMTADTVEECWQLLRQSLMSISYESLAHVPSYSTWLAKQDWTPAYERHRRNLALIGANDPDKRWILKNPSHLFALDALLEVYPDAHRRADPPRAAHADRVVVQPVGASDRRSVGDCSSARSSGARSSTCGRAAPRRSPRLAPRHDPAHFLDVDYDDFVADPVGTAIGVYEHFDLPLTGRGTRRRSPPPTPRAAAGRARPRIATRSRSSG